MLAQETAGVPEPTRQREEKSIDAAPRQAGGGKGPGWHWRPTLASTLTPPPRLKRSPAHPPPVWQCSPGWKHRPRLPRPNAWKSGAPDGGTASPGTGAPSLGAGRTTPRGPRRPPRTGVLRQRPGTAAVSVGRRMRLAPGQQRTCKWSTHSNGAPQLDGPTRYSAPVSRGVEISVGDVARDVAARYGGSAVKYGNALDVKNVLWYCVCEISPRPTDSSDFVITCGSSEHGHDQSTTAEQ